MPARREPTVPATPAPLSTEQILALQEPKVFTRTFDAPRPLVFKAWTDAKIVAQWWGPACFTNPRCDWDARAGGKIHIDMRAPDGTIYPMTGHFIDLMEPEQFVFDTVVLDDKGKPLFAVRNIVTFVHVSADVTTVEIEAMPTIHDPRAATYLPGMEQGWSQSLARLAEALAELTSVGSAFVLSRTFDAPRDLVFNAWTQNEQLMKWFGPKGFTMIAANGDIRSGGTLHYGMRAPNNGPEMWGKWVFREVTPPTRIVMVASFCDAASGTTRHPMATDWPLETLSTVDFTEANGKTTLTMHGVPINATAAERAMFEKNFGGMTQGWGGTLDQLDAYLAR